MIKQTVSQILKRRVVVLDGASGTLLQQQGMPQGVSPEAWCLANPRVTRDIHRAYSDAGSDIIYTCTFGANSCKLAQYGINDAYAINKKLARIARESVPEKVLVAGDIGPTGKFVAPFGSLSFEAAVEIFKEQIRGLKAGGVDLFVIETMIDIQEARAALIAVKEICDAFTIVTMTYDRNDRTLNGTDPVSALITLQSLGADAVGCNCSSGPLAMKRIIKAMAPYASVPLVAKPNAGMPKLIDKATVFNMSAQRFADCLGELATDGAALLGGCCGSTPEHIAALKPVLAGRQAVKPRQNSIAALSSARKALPLIKRKSICWVGEKINPSGKKKMQKELSENKFGLLRSLAKEQELKGADALDVNMGLPGGDEKKLMHAAIELLAVITDLPLVIDSSDPDVVESALRVYPGRALINSISAEEKKIKKMLPLVKKYGAMFILLPLDGSKVPLTFDERKKIIKRTIPLLKRYKVSLNSMVIDGLVMTLSCHPRAALETAKTVAWAAKCLKLNTIAGISNISFGFPGRQALNGEFLRLLRRQGLSMAIINPDDRMSRGSGAARRVITLKDKGGRAFIAQAMNEVKVLPLASEQAVRPISERIHQAVLEGDRQSIEELVKMALAEGANPAEMMENILVPAIIKVGDLFEAKQYFLPQLIASAEAMKKGIGILDPFLTSNSGRNKHKGLIIIATVAGDIHDIGKNIVSLMLKNYGFEIIDLGKDISSRRIVGAVKRHKPDILALSALMTTTMVNMKEVVEALVNQKLSPQVMVGGAVVTEKYARSLGALYAKDGVGAVKIAQSVCAAKQI